MGRGDHRDIGQLGYSETELLFAVGGTKAENSGRDGREHQGREVGAAEPVGEIAGDDFMLTF